MINADLLLGLQRDPPQPQQPAGRQTPDPWLGSDPWNSSAALAAASNFRQQQPQPTDSAASWSAWVPTQRPPAAPTGAIGAGRGTWGWMDNHSPWRQPDQLPTAAEAIAAATAAMPMPSPMAAAVPQPPQQAPQRISLKRPHVVPAKKAWVILLTIGIHPW